MAEKRSPTYRSWSSMIQRCSNPQAAAYRHYGGRGITVCDEWLDFATFARDMGSRPEGTSLDRIDVNRGYSKDNCCWRTSSEQQRNRRDNNTFTLNGETLTLQAWSELTGLSFYALRKRYRAGWPAEVALSQPVSKANSVLRSARQHNRDTQGRFA